MNELVKEFDKYYIYICVRVCVCVCVCARAHAPCKKLDCQRKEKGIRRIIKFYMVDISDK